MEIFLSDEKPQQHSSAKAVATSAASSLLSFAQDLSTDDASNMEVDFFYLETYDRTLEDALQAQILRGLEQNHRQNVMARPFGGSHTLIDYRHFQPTTLLKDAIKEHPFSSPLIPFVDFVLNNHQKRKDDNKPKLPLPEELLQRQRIRHKQKQSSRYYYLQIDQLLKRIGKTNDTNWGESLAKRWTASEKASAEALSSFVQSQYPALMHTTNDNQQSNSNSNNNSNRQKRTHLASYLSPYLARGLLSPKQIYTAIHEMEAKLQGHTIKQSQQQGGNSFLRRLAWRDYAYVVSMVFPDAIYQETPIRSGYEYKYEAMEHKNENNPSSSRSEEEEEERRLLEQWKSGKTGFPLVDAGMRQLIQEGFMPQQARLVVSAFLVEGMNIRDGWKLGRKHFEEYLIDYDAMINTNMWMNAGCVGLDPYYIGLDYKKRPYWDSDGQYVRTWCPELQKLPNRIEVPPTIPGTGGTNTVDCLYTPWKAPRNILENAGVALGETYPHRICNEREGRRQFIQRMRLCRSTWPPSKIDQTGKDIVHGLDGAAIGVFTPKPLIL